MDKKCTAIVLSAGRGSRMGTDTPKQYLDLCGRPVLYYSLKAFQDSFIDEIIIVAAKDDFSFIKEEITDKYGITKVSGMTEGGAQRYDSVLNGLRAVKESDYVFIHDGARPFVDGEMLARAYETVSKFGTAIVAVPSKDTVKITDEKGVAVDTPDRSSVWLMQTPQVFDFRKIKEAYERMAARKNEVESGSAVKITDDAMVMEQFGTLPVHVSSGSYRNIKITTPEDMLIAEAFLRQ